MSVNKHEEELQIEAEQRRLACAAIMGALNGQTITWFARQCEIHPSSIYAIFRKKNPAAVTMLMRNKILIQFNIDILK